MLLGPWTSNDCLSTNSRITRVLDIQRYRRGLWSQLGEVSVRELDQQATVGFIGLEPLVEHLRSPQYSLCSFADVMHCPYPERSGLGWMLSSGKDLLLPILV